MSKYQLTEEQVGIVNTIHNDEKCIKINAFSGSGKTSTIISLVEEIRKTDKDSKILYLVFNRSMIQDSKLKFDSLGLDVSAFTTHGFALKRFTAFSKGEIEIMTNIDFQDYMMVKNRSQKFKWSKYKNILELFNAYTLTYDDLDKFCGNVMYKPSTYELSSAIRGYEVEFFKELYKYFLGKKKYTHGMYIKEYACNCPDKIKTYKYIFIDEAQDISMMALPILKRMVCDKMYLVGDAKQKIYSFLKAIDVFDKFEGPVYPLSISFRFNDEICGVANELLATRYPEFTNGLIKNSHNITKLPEGYNSKTILFRLNAELFEYAVKLVDETEDVKVKFMDVANGANTDRFDDTFTDMIYFYDQLLQCNSYNIEKLELFRSKFDVKYSKAINQYVEIAKKEGYNLYEYLRMNKSMLSLDMVKYFNFFVLNESRIVELLDKVRKAEEITNYKKEYLLITGHRAKGLEWAYVKVANGAWSISTPDELHLCYVAVTRAKNKLEYEPIKQLLEEAKDKAGV